MDTTTTGLGAVTLLTLTTACGTMAPQGTDADGVAAVNYELVSLRDDDFELCHEDGIDDKLEDIIDQYGMMGCTVGVARDGEVLYLHADGLMNEDEGEDYALNTLQPIGSVSKPLTALAAYRLVERGDLALSDTVGDVLGAYASEHPDWVQDATLHQLLTHTSGIHDGLTQAMPDGPNTTPVDEGDVGYLDVDWSAWGEVEDETNGRDPILAQLILSFDDDGTYEANGVYSNIGYLLVGAMIEAAVRDAGFDGFDDYAFKNASFEATWEAWVWWVFAGEGEIRDNSLYSTVQRTPWRQLDGAYPDLAVGYDSSYVDGAGANTGQIDWTQLEDDYGWVAPSGNWMTTIGDLTRLGMLIEEEVDVFDNPVRWGLAKTKYSKARGEAYGYGLYQINSSTGPWGHGGTIDGYTAGVFASESSGLSVAWQCNTTPKDEDDEHAVIHKDITNALMIAANSSSFDVYCDDPVLPDGAMEAHDALALDWYDSLYSSVKTWSAYYGVEFTLSYLEAYIAKDSDGYLALAYLSAGKFDAAEECALSYLGDTQGSWSCGR